MTPCGSASPTVQLWSLLYHMCCRKCWNHCKQWSRNDFPISKLPQASFSALCSVKKVFTSVHIVQHVCWYLYICDRPISADEIATKLYYYWDHEFLQWILRGHSQEDSRWKYLYIFVFLFVYWNTSHLRCTGIFFLSGNMETLSHQSKVHVNSLTCITL